MKPLAPILLALLPLAATSGLAQSSRPNIGELYDLRTDLAQKHNLYGEMPGKVRELTEMLAQIRKQGQLR